MDEGSFAQIGCSITKGDEPLKISWHLHGDVVSSEPGITTTMIGTRTSLLLINSVGYRHSGVYTCRASNPAGSTTHAAELKVNGRQHESGRKRKKGNVAIKLNMALSLSEDFLLDLYCGVEQEAFV